MSIDTNALAERIRALRRARGLSQEALADALEVSRQAVSKWESAQSQPDLDRVVSLAAFFGITTDELLTGVRPQCSAPVPEAEAPTEAKADPLMRALGFRWKPDATDIQISAIACNLLGLFCLTRMFLWLGLFCTLVSVAIIAIARDGRCTPPPLWRDYLRWNGWYLALYPSYFFFLILNYRYGGLFDYLGAIALYCLLVFAVLRQRRSA